MIQHINGILTDIDEGQIVIEACGVGYGISVPGSVIAKLPSIGSELKLYTYYSVKEDSQSLYGFISKADREMFKALIGVNGIGPKGAIAILSVLNPDELRMAIITGDVKSISQAQGIGKRTAERLILELKDKIGSFAADFVSGAGLDNGAAQGNVGGLNAGAFSAGPAAEAIDALTVLGYSRMEAGRAVGMVQLTDDITTEAVLKQALKNLNR